jgi:uncharacterized RDD family membrane protein YckC
MSEREPSVLGKADGAKAAPGDGGGKASGASGGEASGASGGEASGASGEPTTELGDLDPGVEPAGAVPPPPPPPQAAATRRARPAAPVFHAAGFWWRAAAAAVDLAVVLPVGLLLCWLAGLLSGVHLPQSRLQGLDFWLDLLLASDPALLGGLGLLIAIGAVYALVFQITMSRTLGMRLLKVRIIDLYGDPPSTGRALARTGGYLAGLATLGLGFLWIGFDREKRGLHDWLAGTYVVKA